MEFNLCVIVNLMVVSVIGTLDVRQPPSIVEGPLDSSEIKPDGIYYFQRNKIVLPCRATGVPDAEYEWKKNKMLSDRSPGDSKNKGDLIIENPTTDREGYYQCIASNQHGTALSDVLQLKMAKIQRKASGTNALEVMAGDNVKMPCLGIASVPVPEYSWYRTQPGPKPGVFIEERVQLSRRVHIDAEGSLYFSHVNTTDETKEGGMYKCDGYNRITDANLRHGYTTLIVRPSSDSSNKRPVKMFATGESTDGLVVALKGEPLTLQCIFAGIPLPEVSWSKNHNDLPGNVGLTDFKGKATIAKVTEGDNGTYSCTGKNSHGSFPVDMQVVVEERPSFTSAEKGPRDINVTEGEDAIFRCEASAKPAARVHWTINGRDLDHIDNKNRKNVVNEGQTLRVQNVCKSQCGDGDDLLVAQCNASNQHGYIFSSGYLNVIRKTYVVKGPESVNLHTTNLTDGDVVTFNCTAESDPTTPVTITWLYEGSPVDTDDPRFAIDTDTDSLLVYPAEATHERGVSGEYTCVANNSYSADTTTKATLKLQQEPEPVAQGGLGDLWWVFLLLAIILLLLIFCLCCCLCCYRNRGDSYPVDKIEKRQGNDPEKEVLTDGFHEYQRPESSPRKGSRASFGSSLPMDEEMGSMAESYATLGGTYSEDGSFRGIYTYDRNSKK